MSERSQELFLSDILESIDAIHPNGLELLKVQISDILESLK